MDTQRSRAYLKQLFQAGRVPTEDDFNTLIESQVNAVDDQLLRREDGKDGDSLSVGAGKNNTLMSFFSSLENSVGDWSLRLDGKAANLSFSAKDNDQAILTLDPTGKVGIGTDQPQTTLDVDGEITAAELTLTETLNVQGTATVKALSIPGFGTITDISSLKRILGNEAGGQSTSPSSIPVNQKPDNSKGANTGKDASDPAQIIKLDSIPASRTWQKVAGPFQGFQAFQLLAWIDGLDNRSICHGSAVCVDGDPSRHAIQLAQSYKGRPGAKIKFRWKGPKTAYYLECRVRLNFPEGTKIHVKLDSLIP